MFFGKSFLLFLYKELSNLYSGEDIEAQGGTQFVSELKYFLAMDSFKKHNNFPCDSKQKEHKDLFIKAVGKTVYLSDSNNSMILATKNFAKSYGFSKDYDVGSNFFSVNTVRNSLTSQSSLKFPSRHSQLLTITNGVIDIYSGSYENISKGNDYLGGSKRKFAILFIWLSRFLDFKNIDSFYGEALSQLEIDFSQDLIKCFEWKNTDVRDLINKVIKTAELENEKQFIMEDDLQKIYQIVDINNKTVNTINNPHNRIIFGAPGTGKSHKLEIESESFINQKSVQTDIDQQIKDEIAAVVKLSGKLNFLAAIGIKYSEQLKNKSRVQLQTAYNLNGVDELYVGSRAKELLPQIQVIEEEEDKESQIKEHVKKAQSGDNMLQMLTAIGMKYSDFLSESSMSDLKKTYDLKSDAQMWWLYRGAQAMQALSNESEKKPVKFLERVTFHPNYSYAQFVGTYKPMKSKLNQEEISYSYVPGPFMRIYVNAKRNPEKNFLLLIEEINRANVAAVFGDVFQLLDRKSDGTSQYPIAASEDQKNYLESCGINEDEIAIPANMYIWATMNSADQGVLPMDAAFKRRWDFEYLDVDNEEAVSQIESIDIPITKDGKKTVKWNDFRTKLNDKLSDIGVNEDKLLGPFFMSKKSLENAMANPGKFVELFESKVIMYLFEDVVKMQPGKLFTTGTRRYSRICKEFEEKGMELFGLDVEVTEV